MGQSEEGVFKTGNSAFTYYENTPMLPLQGSESGISIAGKITGDKVRSLLGNDRYVDIVQENHRAELGLRRTNECERKGGG